MRTVSADKILRRQFVFKPGQHFGHYYGKMFICAVNTAIVAAGLNSYNAVGFFKDYALYYRYGDNLHLN